MDEVQLVEEFVEIIISLTHMRNVDVYVSGSNSRFLSSDVVTRPSHIPSMEANRPSAPTGWSSADAHANPSSHRRSVDRARRLFSCQIVIYQNNGVVNLLLDFQD